MRHPVSTNASPSCILDALVNHNRAEEMRSYIYIILGKPGPTGKTWLVDRLVSRGYNALEISGDLYLLVDYPTITNHVIVDHERKQVVIVLNQLLRKENSNE